MAHSTEVHDPALPVFGSGPFPTRRGRVIALSVLCGFLLTVIWSAPFVDRVIGDNVANTLLGHDAKETPITGVFAGVLFAFVSGIAGTFTACNIAAFGAVAPMVGNETSRGRRIMSTLRPLGGIAIGIIAVSVVYGVIVALVGTRMPQFSTAATGSGLSPRNIQSMIVYGVVGVSFIVLGLVAAGVIRNPIAGLTRRHPMAPLVLMGVLIGLFLVGRPFALFRIMFRDAAESGNVFYGAAAFTLQSLGNIVVMGLLFLLLANIGGGRVPRWFAADPRRLATVSAVGLLVAGTFTLLYWDLRVLDRLGWIWYPMIGW